MELIKSDYLMLHVYRGDDDLPSFFPCRIMPNKLLLPSILIIFVASQSSTPFVVVRHNTYQTTPTYLCNVAAWYAFSASPIAAPTVSPRLFPVLDLSHYQQTASSASLPPY